MKVLYVSYDGALDPLGATQVVPYLVGLSESGVQFTLISFEKPTHWADGPRREALRQRLAVAEIVWRPLPYHKRPRVPATLWDLIRGSLAIRRLATTKAFAIVHCRGDVAMVMARCASLPRRVRVLYDMRGFFSAERVEGGSWRAGGLIDRWVRRAERANRRRADGVVVLTDRARKSLEVMEPLPPHRVIPTCVDTTRFRPRTPGKSAEFGLAYVGSLGTWYMAREMAAFCRHAIGVIPERPLFLTPDIEEAHRAGIDESWAVVRAVPPDEVPAWLCRARALICFIRPTFSKTFSFPTKIGEALAAGLPVVVNRGIGDTDAMVEEHSLGVLVDGFDSAHYDDAIHRLTDLLLDSESTTRCRHFAQRWLDITVGVRKYRELYGELLPPAHIVATASAPLPTRVR